MLAKLRFSNSDRLAPAISSITWLVVIALIAWLAAHWYWRFAAPVAESPRHASASDANAAANDIAARHLFGTTETAAPPVGEESGTTSNGPLATRFTVVGLMSTNRGAPGFAILSEADKPPITAIEGQEFEPGIRVARILPHAVEIVQGERREQILYIPAMPDAAQSGIIAENSDRSRVKTPQPAMRQIQPKPNAATQAAPPAPEEKPSE